MDVGPVTLLPSTCSVSFVVIHHDERQSQHPQTARKAPAMRCCQAEDGGPLAVKASGHGIANKAVPAGVAALANPAFDFGRTLCHDTVCLPCAFACFPRIRTPFNSSSLSFLPPYFTQGSLRLFAVYHSAAEHFSVVRPQATSRAMAEGAWQQQP